MSFKDEETQDALSAVQDFYKRINNLKDKPIDELKS